MQHRRLAARRPALAQLLPRRIRGGASKPGAPAARGVEGYEEQQGRGARGTGMQRRLAPRRPPSLPPLPPLTLSPALTVTVLPRPTLRSLTNVPLVDRSLTVQAPCLCWGGSSRGRFARVCRRGGAGGAAPKETNAATPHHPARPRTSSSLQLNSACRLLICTQLAGRRTSFSGARPTDVLRPADSGMSALAAPSGRNSSARLDTATRRHCCCWGGGSPASMAALLACASLRERASGRPNGGGVERRRGPSARPSAESTEGDALRLPRTPTTPRACCRVLLAGPLTCGGPAERGSMRLLLGRPPLHLELPDTGAEMLGCTRMVGASGGMGLSCQGAVLRCICLPAPKPAWRLQPVQCIGRSSIWSSAGIGETPLRAGPGGARSLAQPSPPRAAPPRPGSNPDAMGPTPALPACTQGMPHCHRRPPPTPTDRRCPCRQPATPLCPLSSPTRPWRRATRPASWRPSTCRRWP